MVNADDYMRFEYNATADATSVTLSGIYVDATNKQYSGSVSIAPFLSIVLIKQTTLTAATQETTQTLVATGEPVAQVIVTTMTVKVSPNPAREKLMVAVNLPANTQAASMSIYSLGGVRLQTIVMPTTATEVPVDVSSLTSGMYIININYDGHLVTKKFVKQS